MFCYLWEETNDPGQCKFGERFVFAGQDPMEECKARIRKSVGVRKDHFDEGKIRIIGLWDVSEAAEKIGRNHKKSKMDDWLRNQIGYRKGSTGEIHKLSGDNMTIKVNQLLHMLGAPLHQVSLSTLQYKMAEAVLAAFAAGDRIILADLCARFGKTIWSGAVAVELGADLVIIGSYVKTVFTSFAKDLTSWSQFAEYVHVDTSDKDYETQITEAFAAGKKVFAYLSLGNGSKRQERIDYLFNVPVKQRMLIIDEADFGAHQIKQAKPLVDKMDGTVFTIVMTGTNADRAVTHWPMDNMVSVTYPQLQMQKKATQHALTV